MRTVSEAVEVADGNLSAASGLLELRHVAGDPTLTAELQRAGPPRWRRRPGGGCPSWPRSVASGPSGSARSRFLLEPDLKEGRGGLRDVQSMRALRATWAVDVPRRGASRRTGFLLDVRGELHRLARKATDRLMMQEQDPVAEALGLGDAMPCCARFLRPAAPSPSPPDDTWRRVDALARCQLAAPGPQAGAVATARAGVVEQDGEVGLSRDADPAADPVLPLRAAAAAAAGRPAALGARPRPAGRRAGAGCPSPGRTRPATPWSRLLGCRAGRHPGRRVARPGRR